MTYRAPPTTMLAGYELQEGIYDEAFQPGGQPRPQYAALVERLAEIDLDALGDALSRELRERRITFAASADGMFALDPVPRILTAAEWRQVADGVVQRARALERFVADVYGERAIVAAGVVPERAIESSAHLEPSMRGATQPAWLTLVGFDLVRSPDGRFKVLEDQIRMPSGIAYAVAARECLSALHPAAASVAVPIDDAFVRLGEALLASAPADSKRPSIVLLSEGEAAAAWYEHARIARELSIPAVTASALEREDGGLSARVEGRRIELDVVLQRTGEDRFTDPSGDPTAVGELLLGPCREGRLSCVNAPGSGIGDDKLIHAYVEEMIRFYLDEDPLLESVTTYDLGEPAERDRLLFELDDLVVKPRGEMGGEGVVIWAEASQTERDDVLGALKRAPEEFVAQRRIELSCHPTLCDGSLRARRVDLRPFVIRSSEDAWALPGGLSRVALEQGSLLVNSGQGGGVKDTWVLR
jgi:uncharacterized circularly permuted ATP-grasp superfamily protein